jgi:hypothetical protein
MKKIFTILILSGLSITLMSQEVSKQLGDAQSAYATGNLQESRFALQQALHEIDMAIGAEILKLLPGAMGTMKLDPTEDNVSSVGSAGIFITRRYKAGEGKEDSSVEIISDSPMLAGINALLSLPMFTSDPNQKRIRVGGYRALMTKSQDETGAISWNIQVPMGSTLLTFNCNGLQEERKVTDLVNTIKLEEIAKLTR